MSNKPMPVVKLDWSRLLGFDQATPAGDVALNAALCDPRLARLGAKFGVKPGIRTAI